MITLSDISSVIAELPIDNESKIELLVELYNGIQTTKPFNLFQILLDKDEIK